MTPALRECLELLAGPGRRLVAALLACLAALPAVHGHRHRHPPAVQLRDTPVRLTAKERDDIRSAPFAEARLAPASHRPAYERWRDIGGAGFAPSFRDGFRYADARVTVRYQRLGRTFAGRLKAEGLKPNFAYQVKLGGDPTVDPEIHRRIGYLGRWRLPSDSDDLRTNYSDWDYEAAADKSRVESYLLFDWFVTDADGRGELAFSLDSSLHVLWNSVVNGSTAEGDTEPREFVLRRLPAHYGPGTPQEGRVRLCAENEGPRRHRAALGALRLPAGRYRCFAVLTEESFHDHGRTDGGRWATVLCSPVDFIVDPEAAEAETR